VHIGVVLIDRAFFTVEVIKKLKEIGVHFIMPAVKNEKVKEAMLDYNGHHPAQYLTLGKGRESSTSTGVQLRISLKRGTAPDLYFGFTTNIPNSSVANLRPSGVQAQVGHRDGYRVQGKIQAKTTNYALRLLYNVWHYANLLLCKALKTQFKNPPLKLTSLTVHFENLTICGLGPPRH
jgi:hypothetical protein